MAEATYGWRAMTAEPGGWGVVINQACDFAQRFDAEGAKIWKETAQPARMLRALALGIFYTCDRLSTKQPETKSLTIDSATIITGLVVGARKKADYASPERAAAANQLFRVLHILAVDAAQSNTLPSGIPLARVTVDGGPSTPGIVLPAGEPISLTAAAVIVISVAIVGATSAYIADKAAEVSITRIANETTTAHMMARLGGVLQVHASHLAKEQTSGHDIPFSDEEKAILGALDDAQGKATSAIKKDNPSLFPTFKPGTGGSSIVEAAKETSWVIIGGLVFLAYMWMQKGRS